ncbi:hypothetical protein ACG1BZ_12370 [Microbulbifer sp. CNSA002]|uniref:hypothetical protein n=1 Tax=unclassified Microbulbifer TaxID=2619833 RepID=UPI0039B43FE0
MRLHSAVILGALIFSMEAIADDYSGLENPWGFRPYVSLNGGVNRLEVKQDYRTVGVFYDPYFYYDYFYEYSYYKTSSSGSEPWGSVDIGIDFNGYPFELRFSYGRTNLGRSISVENIDYIDDEVTVVERYQVDQKHRLDVFSITGTLDLSWYCDRSCMYLLLGYSFAQLDWSYTMDEFYAGGNYYGSNEFSKSYFHVGLGARYNFNNSFRISAEYMLHNVGKVGEYYINDFDHIEFDLRNLNVLQVGISFIF